MKDIRGLLADMGRYSPATLIPALLSIAGSIVFTRLFVPQSYGFILLVYAIMGPLVVIPSQIFGQPVGRFYAEMLAEHQEQEYTSVVQVFLRWTLTGGTILIILALVMGSALRLEKVSGSLLVGATLGVIAQIIIAILSPILSASRNISYYRKLQVGTAILTFLLPLVLVVVFGKHVDFMIWGNSLASVMMAFPLWRWTQKLLAPRRFVSVEAEEKQSRVKWRMLRFGTPMAVWFLSSSLINTSDRYVIGAFFGTKAVALYGTSYAIATQITSLATAPLVNALWPRIMSLWASERNKEEVKLLLRRATDLYLMIAVPLVGGAAVVGPDVVRLLLGPGYLGGAIVLVPVMAGSVLWGVSMVGHKSMEICERNGLMVWNAVGTAVANVILNILLVPKFGWYIAGYTTLVSFAMYCIITWFLAKTLIPWDIPWLKLVLYACVSWVSWIISVEIPLGSRSVFVDLLVRGLIYCAFYVVVVALVRVIIKARLRISIP